MKIILEVDGLSEKSESVFFETITENITDLMTQFGKDTDDFCISIHDDEQHSQTDDA